MGAGVRVRTELEVGKNPYPTFAFSFIVENHEHWFSGTTGDAARLQLLARL